jgi:ARS binding protein 2
MMGKSHTYARDLPTSHDPFPEVRDGVCRDDDLALRALKPEFRPKRGRRRVDDIDDYEPMSAIEPKRPHLDTSVASYPHSAYPGSASAHPDDVDRYPGDHWLTPASLAPSSAIKSSAGGNYRFLVNETPTTPNPLSAVTPLSAHPDSAFDEPLSAISQSQRMRMRRRHGTAVSSAWPSNNTTPNGKLRGRPPTNRSVKDGPFVTFPANPKTKEGPVRDLTRSALPLSARELTPPATAGSAKLDSPFRVPHMPTMPTPVSATTNPSTTPTGTSGRPKQLSLQVPQHVGNPVRLVTPTVILNGSNDSDRFKRPDSSHSSHPGSRRSPQPSSSAPPMLPPLPFLSTEALKRALVADLVRADVTGRGKSLRGTEARDLADALLASVRRRAVSGSPKASSVGVDEAAADDVLRLTYAAWLGVWPPASLATMMQPFGTTGVKKIHVRRYRVSGDGYESPIDEEDDEGDEAGGGVMPSNVKQTFDIEWELGLGSMAGKFVVKGLVLGEHGASGTSPEMVGEGRDVEMEGVDSPSDWRRKWLEAKTELERTREELRAMRDDVLKVALGQNR